MNKLDAERLVEVLREFDESGSQDRPVMPSRALDLLVVHGFLRPLVDRPGYVITKAGRFVLEWLAAR